MISATGSAAARGCISQDRTGKTFDLQGNTKGSRFNPQASQELQCRGVNVGCLTAIYQYRLLGFNRLDHEFPEFLHITQGNVTSKRHSDGSAFKTYSRCRSSIHGSTGLYGSEPGLLSVNVREFTIWEALTYPSGPLWGPIGSLPLAVLETLSPLAPRSLAKPKNSPVDGYAARVVPGSPAKGLTRVSKRSKHQDFTDWQTCPAFHCDCRLFRTSAPQRAANMKYHVRIWGVEGTTRVAKIHADAISSWTFMLTLSSASNFRILARAAMVSSLAVAACSTGNDQACDGKTSALCSAGGAPMDVGGASGADVGGNSGTGVGGDNGTGGMTSTSTTVVRIIGNQIRDLSIPNTSPTSLSEIDSGADAGIEADGTPIILRGVNRSGTEYRCVQGYSIFDGPSDEASVKAIASWHVNAVRVPLNESCWLNINFDANSVTNRFAGAVYRTAIQNYVSLLHKYNIYPILELHWVAPGTSLATGQLPMPDLDHAADFWKDVTLTFKDDLGVVFELFNEPYPDNDRDTDAAWQCWNNGCKTDIIKWSLVNGSYVSENLGSYQSVGFQQLVDAVRAAEGVNTAANHAILLGGIQYSNRLTQWAKYKPSDPANNLGAAFHIYNFNGCAATSCFDGVPATLAQSTAVLATEIGEDDCQGTIIANWMNWFDSHQMGYLAWTWDAYADHNNAFVCRPASDPNPNTWPLIRDYAGTPMPNLDSNVLSFGQTFHDHLAALAQ